MSNFLREYQIKAFTTAQYPNKGDSFIYPCLGLVGESGEVCEKLKKKIRDDNDILTEDRKEAIKKELGDVMWYLAAICTTCSLDLGILKEMCGSNSMGESRNKNLIELSLTIADKSCCITKVLIGYENKNSRLSSCDKQCVVMCCEIILSCITEFAKSIDSTIEEICQKNLDKLFKRKEEGKIKGDGDNR